MTTDAQRTAIDELASLAGVEVLNEQNRIGVLISRIKSLIVWRRSS